MSGDRVLVVPAGMSWMGPPLPEQVQPVDDFVSAQVDSSLLAFRTIPWRRARQLRQGQRGGLLGPLTTPFQIPEEISGLFGSRQTSIEPHGRLQINFGGESSFQDPPPANLPFGQSKFPTIKVDQILNLNITGSIGDKLDVLVDFDNQREFVNTNQISLNYRGYEDEILQTLELGDIRVSLPSSRFVQGAVPQGNFGVQGIGRLGPLDFKTIASKQEGETSTRTLSISATGESTIEDREDLIKDYFFDDNRHFFLVHPDSLKGHRIAMPNPGTVLRDTLLTPKAGTIRVYLDDGDPFNNKEQAAIPGRFFIDPTDTTRFVDERGSGNFILLIENQDYFFDPSNLIFSLKRPLQEREILAVAYGRVSGTLVGSPAEAAALRLKLLKPATPIFAGNPNSWDLMLRNIYRMPARDLRLADLRVTVYKGNDNNPFVAEPSPQFGGQPTRYLQLMGLDDDGDTRLDLFRLMRDDAFGGPDLLVFPNLKPFFRPTTTVGDTILLEEPNRAIYEDDRRRGTEENRIYTIRLESRQQGTTATSNVNLGQINIVEGSEIIRVGSRVLERGKDYQIAYEIGQVTFLNPEELLGSNPNSQIHITYENVPLLNLQPTSLMGVTGRYDLGPDAEFNTTWIMQSQESLQRRPVLGFEPRRSMIGQVSGVWRLTPDFLTEAVDALPLVETERPSRLNLEGEVALSQPNPNTRDQVFLDDFEGIDRSTLVSPLRINWQFSSSPTGTGLLADEAGDLIWFERRFATEAVNPDIPVRQAGSEMVFLQLEFVPGTRSSILERGWRSMVQPLTRLSSGLDLSEQEFIQFWIAGQEGTLSLDLGEVSEDAVRFDRNGQLVGSGILDTEDKNVDGRLDIGEDTGLDGVSGADDAAVPGDERNDDFCDARTRSSSDPCFNGTEGNRRLDTEDLDLNGVLDRNENVFRYTIDLSDDRFVVPGSGTGGFRLLQIPLRREGIFERIGAPNFRRIRHVRLTVTDATQETTRLLVGVIEIVGTTWLQRGVVDSTGVPATGAVLEVGTKNTIDNAGEYEPPPGVRIEGQESGAFSFSPELLKEQSLALFYEDLAPGDEGRAFRPLNTSLDFLDYESMVLWANGGTQSPAGLQPTLVVQFGPDTLNFYEFRKPLDPGWQELNINFVELARVKRALLDSLAEAGATRLDSAASRQEGDLRVVIRRLTEPPTISRVRQITLGVRNEEPMTISRGEVWVDELRLGDVIRDGGMATYLNLVGQLADFASIQTSFEGRDARFRNLGQGRADRTQMNFSIRSMVNLDQFLPSEWGIQLPVGFERANRTSVPLYRTGSDILIESDTDKEGEQSLTRTTSFSLGYSKNRLSSNPFLRATVDNLRGRFLVARDTLATPVSHREITRLDASLDYSTRLPEVEIPLVPRGVFAFLESVPILKGVVGTDLRLTPTQLNLGSRLTTQRVQTLQVKEERSDADSTRNVIGGVGLSFQPFPNLRSQYRLESTHDLIFPDRPGGKEEGEILPGVEVDRTQSFNASYTPNLLSWLRTRWNYSSSFRLDHRREVSVTGGDSLDARNFNVLRSLGGNVEVRLPDLMRDLLGPPAPPRGKGSIFGPLRDPRRLLKPFTVRWQTSHSEVFQREGVTPSFGFTLGLSDFGDPDGGGPLNENETETVSLGTGLNLLEGLSVEGSFSQTEGTTGISGRSSFNRSTRWPSVQLRGAFQSLPGFLGRILRSATIVSAYQLEEIERFTEGRADFFVDQKSWNPLFSLQGLVGPGIRTNLRSTRQEQEQVRFQRELPDTSMSTTTGHEVRMSYAFGRGGISLFGARIGLKSDLRTALGLTYRHDVSVTTSAGGEPVVNRDIVTTSVQPSLAYDFNRMSSGLSLSYTLREDQKRDIKSISYSVNAFIEFLF